MRIESLLEKTTFIMRVAILAILLSLKSFYCLAQAKKNIVIVGKVVDEHHHSLKDAIIIEQKTKTTAIANKNGMFYFASPRQTLNLIIEFTGYKTLRKEFLKDSLDLIQSDSLFIIFQLELKEVLLESITVTDEEAKLVYDKVNMPVLDYDFYSDYLVLLVFTGKSNKLCLLDSNDKMISELYVRSNTNNLFKDCYSNIHLISDDCVQQIKFDSMKMTLLEPRSMEKFNDYILPIVAYLDGGFFYREYGIYNKSVSYSIYRKRVEDRFEFKFIRDAEAENFVRSNQLQVKRARFGGAKNSGMLPVFYETTLFTPLYAPLVILKDSVFLFDHVDDTVFVYDKNATLSRSYPISYNHQKGWKNELIVDFLHKEVYAKFVSDGKTTLSEVDIYTGRITKKVQLEKIFAKSIKIKNGYAYYLYKDRFQEPPITNLFREKL